MPFSISNAGYLGLIKKILVSTNILIHKPNMAPICATLHFISIYRVPWFKSYGHLHFTHIWDSGGTFTKNHFHFHYFTKFWICTFVWAPFCAILALEFFKKTFSFKFYDQNKISGIWNAGGQRPLIDLGFPWKFG